MPPRNNPLPAAVRLFNCAICDKGYPRQLDYENHLRSYDHNHRQRLADMKRITANNDPDSAKPKAGPDMRSISVEEAGKMPGVGGRFKKIGGTVTAGSGSAGAGGNAAAVGGSRFKKVGVAVGGVKKDDEEVKKEEIKKQVERVEVAPIVAPVVVEEPEKTIEKVQDEDTVMVDEEEEQAVSWEEYDFTKPTGCDHANCAGCKTEGIWSGAWVQVGTV